MDKISFQEITGNAQVCIGTHKALDVILTKTRGAAGQELVRHEKEFTILNGCYAMFDYVGCIPLTARKKMRCKRIIKCTTCPCTALSATIGNAVQLKDWFESVRKEHMAVIDSD